MKPGTHKNIVFLTGAGISAESGLSTFRDANGLWENHRVEDVATPEAFKNDPHLVWKFYSMRRLQAAEAKPNSAHKSLAHFAQTQKKFQSVLITQNVDVLHQRADEHHQLEPICMHGSLHQSSCTHCGTVYFDDYAYFDLKGNYAPQDTHLCQPFEKASTNYLHHYRLEYKEFLPVSPCCKSAIRPHIVWFGEVPLFMEKIIPALESADIFVTIGTSGLVYPAAGFLQHAKHAGAHTVCINKELIPQSILIDEFIQGPAGLVLPEYLRSLT